MIPRETKRPRDYEIMDMVLDRGDAVELARLLSVSPQLIRSWCRPPETEDEFATGKFGPLARLRTTISMVKEDDGTPERAYPIAQYIGRLCGGTYEVGKRLHLTRPYLPDYGNYTLRGWLPGYWGPCSNMPFEPLTIVEDGGKSYMVLTGWQFSSGYSFQAMIDLDTTYWP